VVDDLAGATILSFVGGKVTWDPRNSPGPSRLPPIQLGAIEERYKRRLSSQVYVALFLVNLTCLNLELYKASE